MLEKYPCPLYIWSTAVLCTIFTILLTLWNSEQKNRPLKKLFCFSSNFDETWWNCSTQLVLQLRQVSSKSDEKQKSFINSPFFCSEFQSVSRIVKIAHSALSYRWSKCQHINSRKSNNSNHPISIIFRKHTRCPYEMKWQNMGIY